MRILILTKELFAKIDSQCIVNDLTVAITNISGSVDCISLGTN